MSEVLVVYSVWFLEIGSVKQTVPWILSFLLFPPCWVINLWWSKSKPKPLFSICTITFNQGGTSWQRPQGQNLPAEPFAGDSLNLCGWKRMQLMCGRHAPSLKEVPLAFCHGSLQWQNPRALWTQAYRSGRETYPELTLHMWLATLGVPASLNQNKIHSVPLGASHVNVTT